MTGSIILANATLVLPDGTIRGSLCIRDGRITQIDSGTTVPTGALDCEGDLLMPGMIELHTDNLERHIQPRPKVNWPHAPAIIAHDAELAGVGVTTVFDALRVGSVVSKGAANYGEYARQLADEILDLRARGALKISHFLHLRAEVCSETLMEELEKFGPADRVGIVSLMDHTPGQRQFTDISQLRKYVIGKHGLNEEEFIAHITNLQALSERIGRKHETAVVQAARRFGAVLASHDDTTDEQVAASAAHGVHFAEFPTTREAAQASQRRAIKVMMGAPNLIRGGSHSGNVAARELAELGLLDILSSDYVPSSLLTGAMMLGEQWGNLPRAIATVTSAPADAVGFTDRGQLAEGMRGDVIRVHRARELATLRGTWVCGQRVA